MYQCKSRKHWWTQKEDANKCCNGYHRELRVGKDATYANGCDKVIYEASCETSYGFVWVKDKVDNNAGNNNENVTIPLSYLLSYHNESVQNPFYSTPENITKQILILSRFEDLDCSANEGDDELHVVISKDEMECFKLH